MGPRDPETLRRLYASLRVLSSAEDVHGVLTTVAREAAAALGAMAGAVMLRREDDLITYSSSTDAIMPVATPLGRGAFADPPGRQLPSVRVIGTGCPLEVPDVHLYDGPPGFAEACAATGVRAVLVVPLSGDEGALNLGFSEARSFADEERELAGEYADMASLALGRATAFEREREAASRLRHLEELRSDILTTASHELRTPLTAIRGFTSTLLERWAGLSDPMRHRLLRRISAASEELERLVGDLLDLSRIERGDVALQLQPIDLGIEVPRTIGKLEPLLVDHRVEVDVPLGTAVLAEAHACGRVLGNLVSNAIKFSQPGTRIIVRTVRGDGEIVLRVEDEGIGVPEVERDRIFERFYRVDRKATAPSGTGIGLAVVRDLVDAMGGRVWVEPGDEGSVFCVAFRSASEVTAPQAPERSALGSA